MHTAKTYPKAINHWFSTDEQLNKLYPTSIQALAPGRWTPLQFTPMVAPFLVTHPGVKILDIGSGVGKFCVAGVYYKPYATFYGVEQRKDLIHHAQIASNTPPFLFFNSFYENLMVDDKIDNNIAHSTYLFN